MTTMLKAQYTERGPVPQAVIAAVPFDRPVLAQGQALVAVLAAPINPSDVLMLTGQYGMLAPLPAVGGSEGVGRVFELGPDTRGPAVGQTVLLPAGAGTWATHVVAPAARLIPLPNEAVPPPLAMLTTCRRAPAPDTLAAVMEMSPPVLVRLVSPTDTPFSSPLPKMVMSPVPLEISLYSRYTPRPSALMAMSPPLLSSSMVKNDR